MFISQDDGEIRRLLSSVPELRIKSEDNMEDIRSYTNHKAIELQTKFDLPATTIDEISSKVCERAKGQEESQSTIVQYRLIASSSGMFLFAKLVMNNLFLQTSRLKLNDELRPDRFPRGLEQA